MNFNPMKNKTSENSSEEKLETKAHITFMNHLISEFLFCFWFFFCLLVQYPSTSMQIFRVCWTFHLHTLFNNSFLISTDYTFFVLAIARNAYYPIIRIKECSDYVEQISFHSSRALPFIIQLQYFASISTVFCSLLFSVNATFVCSLPILTVPSIPLECFSSLVVRVCARCWPNRRAIQTEYT